METPAVMEDIFSRAKSWKRRVVLPEAATDERTMRAAGLLLERGWAIPVLLGRRQDLLTAANLLKVDLKGAEFIYPPDDPVLEKIVARYQERRAKEGLSADQVRGALIAQPVLFGAGLVGVGAADGMTAGAVTSTGDVIRAALKLVGLAKGVSVVSSFFAMIFPDGSPFGHRGVLIYADGGVVPDPTSEQLADIAISAEASARKLFEGFESRVALLSFSTKGSASHPRVEKVQEALRILKEKAPDMHVDGELQADAALVPSVGERKAPGSSVAGKATVLIFPDLDSGNISYKLTQRLAGAMALGPLLCGLGGAVNDLSRGASVEDIAQVAAITAVQST